MRWKKLVANIPLSGLSVVLNAHIQQLLNNPNSYKLLLKLTQEVISMAIACGADIPKDFYQFRLNIFEYQKTMPICNSSMKDDFDAKRPLELTAIYENAINIAKKYNLSMPLTEMLYLQLIYLNTNNLLK